MKVLILENGRLFQKILQDLLIELGCTVSSVRTGEEGLELLINKYRPYWKNSASKSTSFEFLL